MTPKNTEPTIEAARYAPDQWITPSTDKAAMPTKCMPVTAAPNSAPPASSANLRRIEAIAKARPTPVIATTRETPVKSGS
ncbi:hypothetical protein D3C73_633770 [compost metagenome]